MMKIYFIAFLIISGIYACDPKPDPVSLVCEDDSIDHLNGSVSVGHITLCNAQGSKLIYEPGNCTMEILNGDVIFRILSTSSSFNFEFTDTVTYECVVLEGTDRVFDLYSKQDSSYMGQIEDTGSHLDFFILEHPDCINSSFFEGKH
jgi:hypothetical protein